MTIELDNDQLPEPGGAIQEANADSLLQRAEKRRAERETNLFLDVPGWDGDMVCEYQILPKAEIKVMAERQARLMRNPENTDRLQFDLDLITRSAVRLYMIDPDSGNRVPIEDADGPLAYDRIAEKLGVADEVKSQADAVRYLTATTNDDGTWKENVVAISRHAQAVARWMKDPSRRTTMLEELLGEY